jgi:predicted polyphosphate/ATP-dependent NAD kinase
VDNFIRGGVPPKAVAALAVLGVAAGLTLAAPVRAASPSTAASRLVEARHHKKPDDERRHRFERRR